MFCVGESVSIYVYIYMYIYIYIFCNARGVCSIPGVKLLSVCAKQNCKRILSSKTDLEREIWGERFGERQEKGGKRVKHKRLRLCFFMTEPQFLQVQNQNKQRYLVTGFGVV